MVTIDADGELCTLVVMMHVDPNLIDEKIQHACELAHQHSKRPGFVSCSIHKTLDNTKIIEYIQWETPEHLQAMRKTFQSESPQPADFAQRIDWGIVNVVEVVEAANLAENTT